MKELDARGLSCPEPVIMLRRAMQSKDVCYRMQVDNIASKENVTRYAEHQGYTVKAAESEGEYKLMICRAEGSV